MSKKKSKEEKMKDRILKIKEGRKCKDCQIMLTLENIFTSDLIRGNYICRKCSGQRTIRYRHKDSQSEEHYRNLNKNWCRIHRLGSTDGNGHYITLKVNKRPFPQDSKCELCEKIRKRLVWHHWNDEKPELGIWICLSCHNVAEGVEANLHIKYLNLKELRASDEPIHNLC